MQRLNGKETALQIRKELQEKVSTRKEMGKKTPHLAAVLVGSDGGSLSYVTAKVKACERVGFHSSLGCSRALAGVPQRSRTARA